RYLVNLDQVVELEFAQDGALVRVQLDQALAGQNMERLAHRRPAEAKAVREFCSLDALAGLEDPFVETVEKRLVDALHEGGADAAAGRLLGRGKRRGKGARPGAGCPARPRARGVAPIVHCRLAGPAAIAHLAPPFWFCGSMPPHVM